MNYVKNNRRRLIAFTKTSIVFATVSPIIINFDSAEAMFKSPVKNPTSPKGGSVQSIISRFEGISSGATSSTLNPPQKPKLLPKPTSISGIKYPYEESSLNVESKVSGAGASGLQSPSTKPKVRFSSKVRIRIFNPNKQIIYTRPKIESSTKPKTEPSTKPIIKPIAQPITKPKIEQSTRPKIDQSTRPIVEPSTRPKVKQSTKPTIDQSTRTSTKPTIDQSTRPITKPITIPKNQTKNLEFLIKVNVASIIKQNLPDGFKPNGPITINFDKESGQELSTALNRFIYKTTQNTLSSLSEKQN